MKKAEDQRKMKRQEFFYTLIRRIRKADLMSRASSLSYDMLMAAIPLFLLFILIGSLFLADPTSSFGIIYHFLPEAITNILQNVIAVLTKSINPGTIGVALATSVWLGSNGINILILGVNASLGFRLRGNALIRRGLAILYTILFTIALLLILVLFVFYRMISGMANHLIAKLGLNELESLVTLLDSALVRLLPLLFFVFILVLFYRTAPIVSYGHISWKESLVAGLVASTGILLVTIVYGYVLDNVSRLSLYFGSLAGLLGLFVWLKYLSVVVIIGAEVLATFRELYRSHSAMH